MTEARHEGSCRCGGISLVAMGDPLMTSYCHCSDCRKATSAPVSAFVGFSSDAVTFSGNLKGHSLGPVTRSFCPDCGTPIAYEDDRLAGKIWLMLGVMDHPENYPPQLHAFETEHLPWLQIEDDLPRQDRFSVERKS